MADKLYSVAFCQNGIVETVVDVVGFPEFANGWVTFSTKDKRNIALRSDFTASVCVMEQKDE